LTTIFATVLYLYLNFVLFCLIDFYVTKWIDRHNNQKILEAKRSEARLYASSRAQKVDLRI